MQLIFQYLLYIAAFFAFVFAILYMMKARRADQQRSRGLYTARMNMSLGVLLVTAGSIQLFLFEETTTVRWIVGSIFVALGLINLYGGYRNHALFKKNA